MAPTADASFPGRNGKLAVAVDDECFRGDFEGERLSHIRAYSASGRRLADLTARCPFAGREPLENVPYAAQSSAPEWAPDGQRLLFWESPGAGLQTMAADGSDRRPVAGGDQGLDIGPVSSGDVAYSADGRDVIFVRWEPRPAVYAQPIEGGPARAIGRVKSHNTANCMTCTFWGTPRWSPDGRFIAVTVDSDRTAPLIDGIWLMNARTGKTLRRLTRAGREPDWAPNSRTLVYRSAYGTEDIESGRSRRGDVFVVSVAGDRRRRIARTPDTFETTPVWSPDGRWIVWPGLRARGSEFDLELRSALYRVRSRGGRPRRIARLPEPEQIDAGIFRDPKVSWQPLPEVP